MIRVSRDQGLLGLLALMTLGSVLAVGGVPPGVVVALGALATASAGLLAFHPIPERRPPLAPAALVLFLSAYTALQTIPLPLSWLSGLSPTAADIWERALVPMGERATNGSLSLEPVLTTTEALKWSIYAVVFQVAAVVGRRYGAVTALGLVFASGVLVALATIGHDLAGAKKVFGLYEPRTLNVYARVGPLLNPNNLAGYLNLAAVAGLAMLQSRRGRISPSLIGGGVAIIVAVAFRSASRAGLILLPVGIVLAAASTVVVRLRSRPGSRARRGMWTAYGTIGLAAVLGLALGVLVADDLVWNALIDESTEKLGIPALAKPMLDDFAAFGAGRGAFESVFLAYRPAMVAHLTYTHPENLAIQWISEWGFGVGIGALAFTLWWFRPSRLGATRSALNGSALVAVAVLFLHNFADLSLELPGIAISATVILGGLSGDATGRQRHPELPERRERIARFAALAAAATMTILSLIRGTSTLHDDRAATRKAVEQALTDATKTTEARAAIRSNMLRHPADYYFPQLGAVLAQRTRSESPMPWIQRALERGPTIGRTHLLLAEVLRSRGAKSQALLELRYAVEMEKSLARGAAALAITWTREYGELLVAVPDGPLGGVVLDQMASQLLAPADAPLREGLDMEALARDASLRSPHERLAQARLDALDSGEAPCLSRGECYEEVLTHARTITEKHPKSSRGAQIEALLAIKDGRPDDARRILAEACKLPQDNLLCMQLLLGVEPNETLPQAVARYAAVACADRKACAAAWDLAASVYAQRSLYAQAQGAAERAAKEQPSVERWLLAADLAERADLPGPALEALQQANRLSGGKDPAIAERIAATRRRGKN